MMVYLIFLTNFSYFGILCWTLITISAEFIYVNVVSIFVIQ